MSFWTSICFVFILVSWAAEAQNANPPEIGPLAQSGQGAPAAAPAITEALRATATNQGDTVAVHNYYRYLHQVPGLVWDNVAAANAQAWVGGCPLERNFGVGYGQNIFVTNDTAPSMQSAVDAWYAQLPLYNFGSPQFTEATEDVTQLIWKATTGVGCAYQTGCSPPTPWKTVLFCFYNPPGNVPLNTFATNVLPYSNACGGRPNEVLSGGTCVCTAGNVKNDQGICCFPHASYTPQQGCYCAAAGSVFEGIGCCPINSRWQGSVTGGECACNSGFYWDGSICKSLCPPFAVWDGRQCVCPSDKYWTGQACCPFSSTWDASINNCVCNPGHAWDGNACACATGLLWNGQACCPPFALWDGRQCYCSAGKYYTGVGCCVFDSVWVGSATTGNCECKSGKYWTGQGCCPFNAVWSGPTGTGRCVCNPGFFWNGSICQSSSG